MILVAFLNLARRCCPQACVLSTTRRGRENPTLFYCCWEGRLQSTLLPMTDRYPYISLRSTDITRWWVQKTHWFKALPVIPFRWNLNPLCLWLLLFINNASNVIVAHNDISFFQWHTFSSYNAHTDTWLHIPSPYCINFCSSLYQSCRLYFNFWFLSFFFSLYFFHYFFTFTNT